MTRLSPVLFVSLAMVGGQAQQRDPLPRLFPPIEIGTLEGPDRDEWQQPDRIMDALGIFDGAKVADVGAGGGWFTVRLARRVEQNGIVYAEDIQPEMISAIERRVKRDGLTNVKTILGTASDPNLKPGLGLHAVLMVDTYPQIREPVVVLKRIAAALAPNGKLGIVDFKLDGAGGPGPDIRERVSPEVIKKHAAAAGLKLVSHETFLKYQYLLIFGKQAGASAPAESPLIEQLPRDRQDLCRDGSLQQVDGNERQEPRRNRSAECLAWKQ